MNIVSGSTKIILILMAGGWVGLGYSAWDKPQAGTEISFLSPDWCINRQANDRLSQELVFGEQSLAKGELLIYERALLSAAQLSQLLVRCSPLDGDYWLTFGYLEARREGVTEKTTLAFKNAFLTGPKEQWVARQRILFAYLHFPEPGEQEKPILIHDLSLVFHSEERWRASGFGNSVPYEYIEPFLETEEESTS